MNMPRLRRLMVTLSLLTGLGACAHPSLPPIPPVTYVDIDRYMGDWYVISSIPSYIERHAHNAIESYSRRPDGRIQTEFRYRDGSTDGKLKTLHPVGEVIPDTGNAVWSMQFIWPIKAQYIVAYLDLEYRHVIVARNKRDYVWIMARTPSLSRSEMDGLVQRVADMGYDVSQLRPVPQRWPESAH